MRRFSGQADAQGAKRDRLCIQARWTRPPLRVRRDDAGEEQTLRLVRPVAPMRLEESAKADSLCYLSDT
jgi:hypothetical protein